MKKRFAAALLVLALALSLCACTPSKGEDINKFDAMTYVDGLIKENYLGIFEPDYLELVGITGEEAQSTYEYGLHMDAEYFIYLYGIEYPTEELEEEIEELYKEIYSHAKYEVVSAARQDDGSYSVKVEVEPINIVKLVETDFDKATKDFHEKYTTEVLNNMTDAQYRRVDAEWADLIVKLYRDHLAETGNHSARTIVVQLELDDDGYYTINSDDFARLDDAIVNYSGAGEDV